MVSLDRSIENADWSKQSWDLGIENIDDLLKHLRASNTTPEHFMELPVYTQNVKKLPWLAELAKHVND